MKLLLSVVSSLMNTGSEMAKAMANTMICQLNHPRVEPWVMITLMATIAITNAVRPPKSKRERLGDSIRLSGVPQISATLINATTMENTNIQRQPREAAMAPPANEDTPPPPHEPMDQKL